MSIQKEFNEERICRKEKPSMQTVNVKTKPYKVILSLIGVLFFIIQAYFLVSIINIFVEPYSLFWWSSFVSKFPTSSGVQVLQTYNSIIFESGATFIFSWIVIIGCYTKIKKLNKNNHEKT